MRLAQCFRLTTSRSQGTQRAPGKPLPMRRDLQVGAMLGIGTGKISHERVGAKCALLERIGIDLISRAGNAAVGRNGNGISTRTAKGKINIARA